MTDDLSPMGSVPSVVLRAAREERSWLDEVLARFLRQGEGDPGNDLRQKERALRASFANSGERVTMVAAYAALLRANSVPELSTSLRETVRGGRFVDAAFQSSGESVLSYPLTLPILGMAPHCDVFVNDGCLTFFLTAYCGAAVNRGRMSHLLDSKNLFIDLGVVDKGTAWGAEFLHQFICENTVDLCFRQGTSYRGDRSGLWYTRHPECEIPRIWHTINSESGSFREPISKRESSAVWEYLDEVLAIARERPEGLFDRYGPHPQRTITKELQEILEPEVRSD